MTFPPSLRRRSPWGDARFFIGILLVAASIAGVWFVVASARQTEPVLVAARTLVPGESIAPGDLQVVDVALGRAGDAYLTPERIGTDLVATRTIEAGELVPETAVGGATDAGTTTIVVRSTVDVPAAVTAGTTVELWSAPPLERGVFDTPRILVPDATVAAVNRDDAMIGQSSASLELVIPRADVAAALAAVSSGAALSVVPIAGAGAP